MSDGAIILFDLTSRITYRDMIVRYRRFIAQCGKVPVVVAANKLDLRNHRKLLREKITFPEKYDIPYYEISIKKSFQIYQPLLTILRQITNFQDLEFIPETSFWSPILDQNMGDSDWEFLHSFNTFEYANISFYLDDYDNDAENDDDLLEVLSGNNG